MLLYQSLTLRRCGRLPAQASKPRPRSRPDLASTTTWAGRRPRAILVRPPTSCSGHVPMLPACAEIPALAAQIRDLPLPEATEVLLASIVAGLHDFDVDDTALQPSDLLAAGTAAYWFGMAHHALTGQLP